jgi:flagellar motor protein MotB
LFDAFIQSFAPDAARESVMPGINLLPDAGQNFLPHPTPPPVIPPGIEPGTGDYQVNEPGQVLASMVNAFFTYAADTPPGYAGLYQGMLPIEYEVGDGYIRLTFVDGSDVFFHSGQATLTAAAREALNTIGPLLYTFVAEGHSVIVEGHTDNVPMRAGAVFQTNWGLSAMRATAVVEHLRGQWDINPLALFALGLGEYQPIDTNETPEGRANNRRVEIRVIASSAVDVPDADGVVRHALPPSAFVIPGTN